MHSTSTHFQKKITSIFAFILITVLIFSPFSIVLAQGPDGPNIQIPNLQVTCAPSATQVRKDTPVRWTATPSGYVPGNPIVYQWSGVNIESQNSPTITTSYGSVGTKTATVTVVSGGATAVTSCSVSVRNVTTTTPSTENNPDNVTPPRFSGSAVEDDSSARRAQGQNQGTEQLTQQLQQLAQSVLQCSVQNILGQGLGSMMNNIGQNIFGGLQGVAGQAIGGAASAASQAVGGGVLGNAVGQATAGGLGGLLGGLMGGGQAVPVDTVSINKYLRDHAAKTTGLSNAGGLFQTPALDAIAYCLSNQVVEHTSEGAARWMNSGQGGNPAFIENLEQHLTDTSQLATEKFIQNYQKKQNFDEKDRLALNRIIQQNQGTPAHLRQNTQQRIQSQTTAQRIVDAYDLRNNAALQYFEAKAELENQQQTALEAEKLKFISNQSFIDQVNPTTKEVIVPGNIAREQAVKRINLPEERLALVDDSNKGSFAELFKKLFSSIPGMILQKVQEKENKSDQEERNNRNATSTRNR